MLDLSRLQGMNPDNWRYGPRNSEDVLSDWYDENNNPITQEQIDALANQREATLAAQQASTLDWYRSQGYDAFTPQAGDPGMVLDRGNGTALYNAGNGVMAYVPKDDQRFIPAPKHSFSGSGFFQQTLSPSGIGESTREMHGGGAIIAMPFLAAGGAALAAGSGAGAAGGGAGAGAVEGGGAGYLGFEGAGVGAAEGGALAGGSEAGTLAGGAGEEAAGGAMGEDLFYDPSYYDAGNTSYFGNSADPYGTGVDIYGNPTGEYSPSTFSGDTANTGYGDTGYSLQDIYNMGQQGYGYGKKAYDLYNKYKGLFGAAAGAAAGALGTSKQSGTTTTTEDLPDWLKGPAQVGVSGLVNAYSANPTGQTPLLNAGTGYLTNVLNGAYLNNNPYLDAMYDKAAGKVSAGVNALFSKGGRYGSGAHQGMLGESLGNLATDIYAGNYAKERTNQQQVGMQAPQLNSSILSSGFVPAQNLLTGIGAVRSRNISTPYFDSTLNNILSGAMGGKALFS